MINQKLWDSIVIKRTALLERKHTASVVQRTEIDGYVNALTWVLEEIEKEGREQGKILIIGHPDTQTPPPSLG